MSAPTVRVPLIIRGEIIEDYASAFPGARMEGGCVTPDVTAWLSRLTLAPSAMSDLTTLRFPDVVEYLDALSRKLALEENRYLQEAYEVSRRTSLVSDAVLRGIYENIAGLFRKEAVEHRARSLLGPEWLDGWTELAASPGTRTRARVRAFGARSVHVIAGNTPAIGPFTILSNALTRGDAIIKSPANDPMTAAAIVRTMIELAPQHPLTRHASVAYWKGGDERVERVLYDPRRIEKIVAWGGVASIRHVLRTLPPGVDLIALDPKQGLALIEASALRNEACLADAAQRLALDIGGMNQEACFSTRLIYMVCRSESEIELASRLAELTYREMQWLPEDIGGPHRAFDAELKSELDALKLVDTDCEVHGGHRSEGAIIVSRNGMPVDFAHRLACRVANIIPVKTLEAALAPLSTSSQTLSIYPDALKAELRDRVACHGVQRIVSLGGASMDPELATPHDGMELLRRMCRWVVEEHAGDRHGR